MSPSAGTLPPVELDDDARALVDGVVQECRERVIHGQRERAAIRRREALVAQLCERLPRRQVSTVLVAALLEAGFTEAELNRHGVKYGGVRAAAEKARDRDS